MSNNNNNKDNKDTSSSKDLLFLDPESKSSASPFLVDSKNSTNTNTSTTTTTQTKPKFEKLPPSSILSRARDFLPQLAEANKKLESDVKNNTNVNIEDVDESKPYIRMKLALGVLEEQKELTEDTITIPSATNTTTTTAKDNVKPIIEILTGHDSSDDESNSSDLEEENEDVKMQDTNNDQT